jgi:hypothetical protein
VDSCEHDNESLGSIGGEFVYQLSDCQLLTKDSAPGCQLIRWKR